MSVFAHQDGVWLSRPWVTALAFSGGKGSSALLWMVLRGEIERPKNFLVLCANPGMENSHTYTYIARMERECVKARIPFIRVERDLYQELMDLKASGATRFDTPPYWTKDRITGKRGRLLQTCTMAYKIAPMDRALRLWMEANLGVARNRKDLGSDAACKWLGFSNDEWMRIKEARTEYQYFEYPLIERKIGEAELIGYYMKNNLPIPPRSVCNACFANDVEHFREMHANRPNDWEQAVRVDEEIRDLTCIGVRDECYVSWTLVPLRELAERGFPNIDGEKEAMQCHSGHCFV